MSRSVFNRVGAFILASGGAAMAAACLLSPAPARAQDQSAATTKDLIFARKIVMNTIGKNMDELEGVLETDKKIDLPDAAEHADAISVLLMAFPHLFAPASNQWKAGAARDPGVDTFASPDAWTNYAEFYRLAGAASKTAFNASRARDEATFRKFGAELRATCDACHAAFMKQE